MSELNRLLAGKIPCAETGIEVRQTICDICCPSFHCGVDAYVKDGKIIKIEGTADHPTSRGLLCAKGLSNRQYVYREDRLRTPLRRVGPRGEGRFEPISWDEAYGEIAERLLDIREKHGPEAVVFYSGYSKWYRPYFHRLVHSFGSLNYLTESSNCMTSTFLNWLVTTGNVMSGPDTPNAGVYLGWAYNPYHSRHLAALGVEKRKAEGMKVIIVDPRITKTTLSLADIHLRPRPGTDGALALGLAHVLIRDGAVDRDYIDRYVYGFEAYSAYVKSFTPDHVERLTGVPADQIEAAARMIAENLPLGISESAAPIAHHANGFQSYRAIMALSAITGCFDRPGGQIPVQFSYNYQVAGFKTLEEEFINETKPKNCRPAIGAERFPLWNAFINEGQANDLSRQIEEGSPYPLKALFGMGFNHRISADSPRLQRALMSLDFLVNTELFMTDTCKFCDIVLPACTSFERSELKAYGGGHMICTNPVIEPLYDSRPDVDILCDLARAMKLGDELLEAGAEACFRHIISNLPVSLETLKSAKYPVKLPGLAPYIPGTLLEGGLDTESGKFELYSLAIDKLKDRGLKPLPEYEPPLAGDEEYPFALSSARITNALHSRLNRVPWNRSLRPEPMADIAPAGAEALGIRQEDEIELYSPIGSVFVKANLSAKVAPGEVYLFHGYPEADANALTSCELLDPYSGFAAYRGNRVGIRRRGK